METARKRNFITARRPDELTSRAQKNLFWVWNAAALLASSLVICVLSLMLGLGMISVEVFYDYFRHPLIFLLNWVPVLLLTLFCYGLTGRKWITYLLTWILVVLPSIGSFYKQRFRAEPLTFSDMSSIKAGLSVASKYDLTPNVRIILAVAALPVGILLLFMLVKGRPSRRSRLVSVCAPVIAAVALWFSIYRDDYFYKYTAVNEDHMVALMWSELTFISKGSVYPFLHSIATSAGYPPANYSASEAEAIYSAYTDADIPEERRVNLMVFQLESFCDMSRIGLAGLNEETYELYHALEEESYTGILVDNVMGGGTINTERTFLTGSFQMFDYSHAVESYVRYFNRQGYTTLASHPHVGTFYSRIGVNEHLGFDEFWYKENHYEADVNTLINQWMSDRFVFPDVLEQYEEHVAQGENVFSFTVTTQGHGSYYADRYDGEVLHWDGEGCTKAVRNQVNNYLDGVVDTQEHLTRTIDALRDSETPVVVIVYGDHMPRFTNGGDFYSEAGINIDVSTLEGCLNYYSTRYLIWANDAAKAQLCDDFIGDGPAVSPCFLLSLVFDKMGWDGSAYMQFSRETRDAIPVINTNGFYIINGQLFTSLAPEQQELYRRMEWVQYYLNRIVYSE